jgi:hypothetical protein
VGKPNQSEQDKWMAHPSLGVNVAQFSSGGPSDRVLDTLDRNGNSTSPGASPTDPSLLGIPADAKVQPQPDPEAIVRKYLDDHQFAPPEQQPDGAEQHVLLNGRDLKLSEAEKQVAAATKQPADLVHRVLTTALGAPKTPDWSFNPLRGPGNELPGIHPSSTDPALQRQLAKANELQTLDAWLVGHGFEAPNDSDPDAKKALFDGQDTTIDVVADKAMKVLGNSGAPGGLQMAYLTKDGVVTHLRQKYARSRTRKDNSHLPQIQVQYLGTPKATQAAPGNLTDTHQFTFQVVFQHGDSNNKAGFDLTAPSVSVTFDSAGNVVQAGAGAQGAWAKPLLGGWLQAAGFVQGNATVDFTKDIKGNTVLGSAGFQAVGGGQIALAPVLADTSKFAFLSGHVQFGIQVQGGIQDKFSGPQKGVAPIAAGGGFLTLSF